MSGIAIYMEGGGTGKENRAALRQGMDAFLQSLKEAARNKALRWKLVCCGPRQEAFRGFRNAVSNGDNALNVLLVDAEGPVDQSSRDHLEGRDHWDLGFAEEDRVHLMVQAMEAWIVADLAALAAYYGQGFRVNRLPKAENLETVPKADVTRALDGATRRTRKGAYHKVRHASDLLKRIDAGKVRTRCARCEWMFERLGGIIAAA